MTSNKHDIRPQIVALLPRLRRFAKALCGNLDQADDIVQAACMKALGRLDQFEQGTRLDSWMFRIVQTTYIDHARSGRRRAATPIDDQSLAVVFDARIHESAEARADLAIVRDEIGRMPEEQRAVLALVAVDGVGYAAAAGILGIPVGTVMSRLARARKRLAAAIDRTNDKQGH